MTRKTLAAVLVASLFPLTSHAACNASSLEGTWDVKYRYSKPQQVGECTYVIDGQGIVDGSCFNITYGQKFNFFDAATSIKGNCKFKSVIILTDGSTNVADGTLRPPAGYASGTLTARSYGMTFKGTFTMKKR